MVADDTYICYSDVI